MTSPFAQAHNPEFAFSHHRASLLPAEKFDRWHLCRSGHTFQSFYGKKLVAYTILDSIPTILKVLVCEDFAVSLREGTSSLWVEETGQEEFWITHTPVEVAPNCFMWHLQHTTLDFNEHRGRFNVKFNIALRTPSNPSTKEVGKVYLMEYAKFRHQYVDTQ